MGRKKRPRKSHGRPPLLEITILGYLLKHPDGLAVRDIPSKWNWSNPSGIMKTYSFSRQGKYLALQNLEIKGLVGKVQLKRPTKFKIIDTEKAQNYLVRKFQGIYPNIPPQKPTPTLREMRDKIRELEKKIPFKVETFKSKKMKIGKVPIVISEPISLSLALRVYNKVKKTLYEVKFVEKEKKLKTLPYRDRFPEKRIGPDKRRK